VFLIDQSGSMSDSLAGEPGKRKADKVADSINRLLQNLVIKCTKSEGVRDFFEVAVIGYGAKVGPAFSGKLAGSTLVPMSQIASSARIEPRTKKVDDQAGGLVEQTINFQVWFDAVASGGTPMCEAFNQTHNLLEDWVSHHSSSYPPIVINITDGEATDGDPTPVAQSVTSLTTSDGNVLLLNCHISASPASPIAYPESDNGLSDEFARLLFRMSSVLPENIRAAARSEGMAVGDQARGFVFNADLEALIRFLDIGTRPSNLR